MKVLIKHLLGKHFFLLFIFVCGKLKLRKAKLKNCLFPDEMSEALKLLSY